jgi:hypothetical protein
MGEKLKVVLAIAMGRYNNRTKKSPERALIKVKLSVT